MSKQSGESAAREQWPSIEFEKEAHRLAREDDRGKLLSRCLREIVHEQGFDETGGPSCECCELAHPLILIHAATRAMELYAAREREEWIPVSERLPRDRDIVNVVEKLHQDEPSVAQFRQGEWELWGVDGLQPLECVTHWRQLPAAPFAAKGETE